MNKRADLSIRIAMAVGFVAFVVTFFPDGCFRHVAPAGPGAQALAIELARLRVPPQMVPADPPLLVQRGGPVGASQHFILHGSFEDLLVALKKDLPQSGWVYQSVRASAQGDTTMKFCRGGRSLRITATPGSSRVYVSLLWTNVERHPVYCPPVGS